MLLYRTYADLRAALQQGETSCKAVVEHFLSAIAERSSLNAFLSVYTDEALAEAERVDAKLASGTAGKLAGLVVGIKDVLCYAQHPVQGGSQILDGFNSQFSATAVQRLVDEDAIIIGRHNCDEFGMGSSNENSAFGPVKNPVDESRVPGGSSGGSAAAIAAGLCHVALGSDTGGSVRQPAAFCGTYGLKPTYSRVSRHGLVAYASSFDTIGVFAQAVEDVALVLETIAGGDEWDSTVSHQPVPAYSSQLGTSEKMTIGYLKETLDAEGLQPEIKAALETQLGTLEAEGHTVKALEFPLLQHVLPIYYLLTTAEASANLQRFDGVRYGHRSEQTEDLEAMYKNTRSEGFGAEVQRRIMLGTFALSASYYDAYYTKAQKARRLVRDATLELLEQVDTILIPTTPTTAFPLGSHTQNPLEMYLADLYTVQASVAGIP
ncbi:MAG TPA: Asp-tRNA(Asn)/Glu-tRNA(Gln) amidotransferase GatCAB subunit A, partial [Cytophagales bacterium]|nr:Asp-tRNA(Asn)/Glu-tRNA(Gln) amidotransferase GatCAB subunit A [Cytophagales bacterium]